MLCYAMLCCAVLCGEMNVKDANESVGKRTTFIYTLNTVDMTGNTVLFEYWGANAEKAERYYRNSIEPNHFISVIVSNETSKLLE